MVFSTTSFGNDFLGVGASRESFNISTAIVTCGIYTFGEPAAFLPLTNEIHEFVENLIINRSTPVPQVGRKIPLDPWAIHPRSTIP